MIAGSVIHHALKECQHMVLRANLASAMDQLRSCHVIFGLHGVDGTSRKIAHALVLSYTLGELAKADGTTW
jgi:hypothetical protein